MNVILVMVVMFLLFVYPGGALWQFLSLILGGGAAESYLFPIYGGILLLAGLIAVCMERVLAESRSLKEEIRQLKEEIHQLKEDIHQQKDE